MVTTHHQPPPHLKPSCPTEPKAPTLSHRKQCLQKFQERYEKTQLRRPKPDLARQQANHALKAHDEKSLTHLYAWHQYGKTSGLFNSALGLENKDTFKSVASNLCIGLGSLASDVLRYPLRPLSVFRPVLAMSLARRMGHVMIEDMLYPIKEPTENALRFGPSYHVPGIFPKTQTRYQEGMVLNHTLKSCSMLREDIQKLHHLYSMLKHRPNEHVNACFQAWEKCVFPFTHRPLISQFKETIESTLTQPEPSKKSLLLAIYHLMGHATIQISNEFAALMDQHHMQSWLRTPGDIKLFNVVLKEVVRLTMDILMGPWAKGLAMTEYLQKLVGELHSLLYNQTSKGVVEAISGLYGRRQTAKHWWRYVPLWDDQEIQKTLRSCYKTTEQRRMEETLAILEARLKRKKDGLLRKDQRIHSARQWLNHRSNFQNEHLKQIYALQDLEANIARKYEVLSSLINRLIEKRNLRHAPARRINETYKHKFFAFTEQWYQIHDVEARLVCTASLDWSIFERHSRSLQRITKDIHALAQKRNTLCKYSVPNHSTHETRHDLHIQKDLLHDLKRQQSLQTSIQCLEQDISLIKEVLACSDQQHIHDPHRPLLEQLKNSGLAEKCLTSKWSLWKAACYENYLKVPFFRKMLIQGTYYTLMNIGLDTSGNAYKDTLTQQPQILTMRFWTQDLPSVTGLSKQVPKPC